MLYRIYTEDKNWPAIQHILDFWIDGYTVTKADGYWKGQHEASLVIDVITDQPDVIMALAESIRRENGQEAVLVYAVEGHATLVEAKAEEAQA